MDAISTDAEQYLSELFRRTEGNVGAQVSMFDVGAAMGLEKEAARRMAEDLIAEGLVEIKTLSGGIGITAQGIEAAQPAGEMGAGPQLDLGSGPLLEQTGRAALEHILAEIKNNLASAPTPYALLEEMVVDIKTIEVQLLSPRPKISIIRKVLYSLKDGLDASGSDALAGKLAKIAGE